MNTTQITDGGHLSTTTFWEVSIPLVVTSIIIPVAFSGLLIRMAVKFIRSSYREWVRWRPFFIAGILIGFNIASAVVGGRPLFWIVWTLNLLYTIEFLVWVPYTYQQLLFASHRLKDAVAERRTYMSRKSNAARASNHSTTESSTARGSNASRSSGETASSWVTAHSDAIEGSSISNNSDSLYVEVSEEAILRKQLFKCVFQAFFPCTRLVVIIGGLGLGTAFLTLDILYPDPKGLSVYHSFALWMSLVPVPGAMALKILKHSWGRVQLIYERHEAKKPVSRRRRRGSDASQSERNSRIASDGAV